MTDVMCAIGASNEPSMVNDSSVCMLPEGPPCPYLAKSPYHVPTGHPHSKP